MSRPKLDQARIPAALAMSAPAVPLALVVLWADRKPDGTWEADHVVYPVLALCGQTVDEFSHPHRAGIHRRPATADLAVGAGWTFEGTSTEFDALVYDPECGLVLAREIEASNALQCVVLCPGPDREDKARIARAVHEMKTAAFLKVTAARARPTEPVEASA